MIGAELVTLVLKSTNRHLPSASSFCIENATFISSIIFLSSSLSHYHHFTKGKRTPVADRSKQENNSDAIVLCNGKGTGELLNDKLETRTTSIHHPQQELQEEQPKQNQQRNLIYVKIGKTEHPAFELLPDDAPAATSKDSDSVWVKWASNGKKECVFKYQIVKGGLQARTHKQPDYYHKQHTTTSSTCRGNRTNHKPYQHELQSRKRGTNNTRLPKGDGIEPNSNS